jgi:hypothetical protein
MKKALLQSKWWWYIPIFSLFFIEQQSAWVLEAEDEKHNYFRNILVTLLLAYHACFFVTLLTKII